MCLVRCRCLTSLEELFPPRRPATEPATEDYVKKIAVFKDRLAVQLAEPGRTAPAAGAYGATSTYGAAMPSYGAAMPSYGAGFGATAMPSYGAGFGATLRWI